jgi:hypothetical protein
VRPAFALSLVALAGCGRQLLVGDEARDGGPGSLLDGLVAYWRLDDRGNLRIGNDVRTADSSGNGNHAAPESVSLSDWRAGHSGSALAFGQAGWLRTVFTPSVNSIRTGITIATWIRIATPEARDQVIMQRQAGTGTDVQWVLRMRSGRPSLEAPSTGACDAPTPLPVNQWVHLAATYDGRTQRINYDGQEVSSCPSSGAFAEDITGLTVGTAQVGPDMFEVDKNRSLRAVLDEVMLYSRALAGAELQALAAGQLPPVR